MTSLREWLDSIGLGQYAAAFAEHSIDWDVLPNLNHQVLKDVGVIAAGDRIRLLSAIKDLSSSDSNFEITSSPLDREIVTSKRGKRIATSIDGTLTGLGGNLIIIDDPLKLGDAMSEAVRTRVIEWYRSTLLSRADDKKAGRIVLVMQWVHQDDLAGYLQEQGGFEVLNLPAIAQRNEAYELGDGRIYNRQKGKLLHPEQEPADRWPSSSGRWARSPFRPSTSKARSHPAAPSSSANG
jgi:hypothetical protein